MKRKRTAASILAAVIFLAAATGTAACGKEEEIAFAGKFTEKDGEEGEGTKRQGEGQAAAAAGTVEKEYPVLFFEEGNDYFGRNDYIYLQDMEAEKHYQVESGDTLWGIAHDLYGQGRVWPALMKANTEQIQDENLIFPGMELLVPRNCFIKRQNFSRGGFSSTACSYDVPRDWTVGWPKWEICLEYSYYPGEGNYGVYTHVTQNRLFPEGVGDAWEDVKQKIMQISEDRGTVLFTLPEFERYRKEDGGELLFYHFIAYAGERSVQIAVAYVPGETYLAEFIGICPFITEEDKMCDIVGITRYMAASYEEEGGEKEWDSLKYRPYLGEDSWLFEDLHNPFAIAVNQLGVKEEAELAGTDREVNFVSKEWEELLRKMICYHFDYSDEQREEFMARPVYLSELAWIEEVRLIESPIPGRDTIAIQGLCPPEKVGCAYYNLTTLADIAVLPNLQKLTLEIGTATDYESLAACPSLRELSITGEKEMREISWLLELPNLESLTLNVSYIPHLLAMGVELEDGTTFSKEGEEAEEKRTQEENQEIEKNLSIEKILSMCTSLTYLKLEYTGEMDYSFLENLPRLYTFILDGADEEEAREKDFEKGLYPQIKCLVVDGHWLRNPA